MSATRNFFQNEKISFLAKVILFEVILFLADIIFSLRYLAKVITLKNIYNDHIAQANFNHNSQKINCTF